MGRGAAGMARCWCRNTGDRRPRDSFTFKVHGSLELPSWCQLLRSKAWRSLRLGAGLPEDEGGGASLASPRLPSPGSLGLPLALFQDPWDSACLVCFLYSEEELSVSYLRSPLLSEPEARSSPQTQLFPVCEAGNARMCSLVRAGKLF